MMNKRQDDVRLIIFSLKSFAPLSVWNIFLFNLARRLLMFWGVIFIRMAISEGLPHR